MSTRYYASSLAPRLGDKVMVFSNHVSLLRFRDQTTVSEVDEHGNVRVKYGRGWYNPFHFTLESRAA